MIVLYFIFYSIIGWIYESTLCSLIKYKKCVNRGFMVGPYCPIYGCGALLTIICIKSEHILLIFIGSMILSSTLEYITAYLLEKLFLRKWWDYSHFPLNLHGRICIYASSIFGIANVMLVRYIHPQLESLFDKFDGKPMLIGILIIILSIDVIYSVKKHYSVKNVIREVYANTVTKYDYSLQKCKKTIYEKKESLSIKITEHIN